MLGKFWQQCSGSETLFYEIIATSRTKNSWPLLPGRRINSWTARDRRRWRLVVDRIRGERCSSAFQRSRMRRPEKDITNRQRALGVGLIGDSGHVESWANKSRTRVFIILINQHTDVMHLFKFSEAVSKNITWKGLNWVMWITSVYISDWMSVDGGVYGGSNYEWTQTVQIYIELT
jgi:hypothetical protein